MTRSTAVGIYDHGYVVIADRRPGQQTEGASTARAGRIVLATGAVERPLVFRDNDRPGIMLAGSAAAYVERFGARVGGSSSSPPTPGRRGGPRPRGGRGGDRRARGSTDQRPGDRHRGDATPAASLPCSSTGEGSKRICCWSPAAGIPTSRCGAGRNRSGTTKTFSTRGARTADPAASRSSALADGDGLPGSAATWLVEPGRRRRDPLRRSRARRYRGGPAARGRRWADVDRAHQALHDRWDRERPGQDVRRTERRDRGGVDGPGPGAAGVPTFHAAVHAGQPGPGRPSSGRSRIRSARHRCRPGMPTTARSSRTSASGNAPATSRATVSQSTRRCPRMRRGPRGRGRHGRHHPRQDRSPGPDAGHSSTASTPTRSRRWSWARAATG